MEVNGSPRAEDLAFVPFKHKGVQTEEHKPIHQTASCEPLEEDSKRVLPTGLEPLNEDRSVEECLTICKSEVKIQLVSGPTSVSEASFIWGITVKEAMNCKC